MTGKRKPTQHERLLAVEAWIAAAEAASSALVAQTAESRAGSVALFEATQATNIELEPKLSLRERLRVLFSGRLPRVAVDRAAP